MSVRIKVELRCDHPHCGSVGDGTATLKSGFMPMAYITCVETKGGGRWYVEYNISSEVIRCLCPDHNTEDHGDKKET